LIISSLLPKLYQSKAIPRSVRSLPLCYPDQIEGFCGFGLR
jgi:hypothetical protein